MRLIGRALLLASLISVAAACGDNLDGSPGGDGDGGPGDGDAGGDGDGFDQHISIPGLDGPVSVYFDAQGILHAGCTTDRDCFAAEGYFHAAHRFAQMDIARRLGRGRLSALAGNPTLATDRHWRQMMTARDGTPLAERLLAGADAQTMTALEGYSLGVNAWLADLAAGENGAVLADEYDYPIINQDAIQDDWEPLDSVACILPLVDALTNHSDYDILAGEIYAALGAEVATDLFGVRPPSDSVVLPQARSSARAKRGRSARRAAAPIERLRSVRGLLRRALADMPHASMDHSSRGSNNWVVGPSRTSGGVALMANDPHLQLSHPAIWYLVHLDARTGGDGSLHVAGASFPGLPGVLLGHNEDIAWGATTTYFDATDVYVETLNDDRTAVIFNGEEVPMVEMQESFEVAGLDEPATSTFLYVPHHGPVIAIDEEAGTALSVRWTGHDADTDINFFLALASATSLDEAREALTNVTTAGQNFVVIDREGNIGWFPYNRLPTRPWASLAVPSYLPIPGDGTAEWGPPVPYEDLPQVENPAAGFVATANNDMTGSLQDGDPYNDGHPYLQGVTDEGYRHERIVDRLAASESHDLASMQSIQADVFSLVGEVTTPAIIAAVKGAKLTANAQAVVDALAAWDFQCPTGIVGSAPDGPADASTADAARGCAAFHVTFSRLRLLAFGDELDEAGINQAAQPSAVIFALTRPELPSRTYWDDVSTPAEESEADIVAAALDQAGAFLSEELGADPADWLWGRIHTVTLRANLFDQAGVTEFNSGAFTNDGGLFTVDVAAPRNEIANDYTQSDGPSMRQVCEASSAGVQCTIELPGGQRHDRDSPYYDSMLDEWLANEPVPFAFSVEEVAGGAAESVRLDP